MTRVKDQIELQKKKEKAYKKFLNYGWKPEQASAIVGNLIHESNLDTGILGTADDKGSRGIGQWHSERLKTLQKRYGSNWTDFDNQLEFVNWELNNTEKKAGDALRQAKGLYNTGRIVSDLYERPKVKWYADDRRQSNVYDIHNKFSGVQLTAEDKANFLKGTAQRAIDNYNTTQNVTSNVIDLSLPQQNTTFASVPDVEEPKEVVEAKQSLQQKQAEENFLNELNQQNFAFEEPQQPKQVVPQISPLERYAQIESFVGGNPVAQQGGNIEVKDSKIQGVGVFATNPFKQGSFIGLAHTNGQPSTELGRYHNHSENPNAESVLIGNERYLITKKAIKNGEEITVDYRKQPELEQPEDFNKTPQLTQQEINFLKDIQNKNKFQ